MEEDGTLMCSYHAWRWDGEGDLSHVPQAQDTELERLKKNPKSKCNSFPIKEKNGLLWVWPSSGSDARILSELTPVADMQLEGLVEVEELVLDPGDTAWVEDPGYIAGRGALLAAGAGGSSENLTSIAPRWASTKGAIDSTRPVNRCVG